MVRKGKRQGYSIGVIRKKKILFTELCKMYFKRCEANGISHHTVNGYKNILKHSIEFKGTDDIYCDEIDINTFDLFKIYLKQVKGLKDISVNSYIRKLTPMLSYGMELGHVEGFPYIYVKHQEVYKDIYAEQELVMLLKKPEGKHTTNRFGEFRNWVIRE